MSNCFTLKSSSCDANITKGHNRFSQAYIVSLKFFFVQAFKCLRDANLNVILNKTDCRKPEYEIDFSLLKSTKLTIDLRILCHAITYIII